MTSISDQDKLRALLPHWIEHNAEHGAEFRNWADRARAAGLNEVAEELDMAAKQLSWVNGALSDALHKLPLSA